MLSRLTSCGSWCSRLTSALVSPQHATESLDTGGGTTDYAVCCLPTVSSLPPSGIILECDYHGPTVPPQRAVFTPSDRGRSSYTYVDKTIDVIYRYQYCQYSPSEYIPSLTTKLMTIVRSSSHSDITSFLLHQMVGRSHSGSWAEETCQAVRNRMFYLVISGQSHHWYTDTLTLCTWSSDTWIDCISRLLLRHMTHDIW